MNRIARRSTITLLLALILVAGFTFFVAEFIMEADTWVVSAGSPHVYNATNIGTGTVVERDGALLLDMNDTRSYSTSETLRKSTLHWLGDRDGYISAPILANYAAEIAGYDMISGLYTYGDNSGIARLTLSAKVQNAALEAMGGYSGSVAVYNYKTGELLCAVTTPTYDPDHVPDIEGDTTGAYEGVYLNRFVQSVYIPGSIYKIVTLAAALETIDDIEEQSFFCNGAYEFGVDKITCESGHGTQTLQQAFRNSCNCAFGQIAIQVGAENMELYAEKFGLTEGVAFDGITTAAGNYSAGCGADANLAWSGIGQYKDQVNPCAFLTFMGAIASGGKGVTPYLVEEITVGSSTTYRADTDSRDRILSNETAQKLSTYLRANVTERYGDWNFPELSVCAKTGTGEVGEGIKPNAMLAGFVQNEEYPFAFIVFVENAGYGANICIPIAASVLEVCKSIM